MDIKTASLRLSSLLVLYDMHTIFFNKVLDTITDIDAHNRLKTKANHIAWLTGSLVQQRVDLAQLLGKKEKQQAEDLFKDHQGIIDGVTYPPLKTFMQDWDNISPIARAALTEVTDAQLDKFFEIPEMSMSYFDFIAFVIYREANCIGQIALWRRLLNYPAMNYR